MNQAEINKRNGMNVAMLNAHAHDPAWCREAYSKLMQFIDACPGDFMVEDVREWAAKLNFAEPPNKRAWGGVIVRASKEGIIRFKGYRKTVNPLAHGTPASVWEKVKTDKFGQEYFE